MKTSTKNLVETLQNLYHKLHNGFIGVGVNRIPIAGDTTKLPLATGLTKLEKKLAWGMHFLAQNLPGFLSARQTLVSYDRDILFLHTCSQ